MMMASATVSMEVIKQLREQTGAGVMDVKKALEQAEGDTQKALEILRQKGAATAEKKAARVAAEGMVATRTTVDNRRGAIVEVNCETDFAAKNDRFVALVNTLADASLGTNATTVEALMAQTVDGQTLEAVRNDVVLAIRENMSLRRFEQLAIADGQQGVVQSYVHGGGKIGVLVALTAQQAATVSNPAFQALAKDLSLHIAASQPQYVSRADIPQSVIDEETRIEMGKEDLANKPEPIRAKIVEGRVSKLLGQVVLLEQPFVKDPGKTIEALIQEVGTQLGDQVALQSFVRYTLGEGVDRTQTED